MQGGLPRLASGTLLTVGLLALPVSADEVLVTANGHPITQSDLHLEAVLRQIPEDQFDAHRDELIESVIDQHLIATFVARRRLRPNPIEVENQLERIDALIRRRGEEPDALLNRLGITQEQIRQRLELSLAWKAYVEQVTSDRNEREYFEEHRRELDGTQLRARHILLVAAPDDSASRQAARTRIIEIREQIQSGQMSFEEAAKRYSQAPSSSAGGDIGYFGYRGTMPAEFAEAAFALKMDELSQPVETSFGLHLITVIDEQPGQLSLEDVRPQLLQRISRDLWDSRIAEDRPRAVIQRP